MAKYGNKKTVVDGITFASKKEANRYCLLKLMERGGLIRDLELQPPYRLEVNGVLVCKYVADFRYVDAQTGEAVVEDAKGFKTREYNLKKKLVKAVHGIEIREV